MTRHLARLWVGALVGVVALAVVLTAAARPAGAAPAQASPTQDAPPGDSPCAAPDGDAQAATVLPDDCWGRYPSSHYDLGCDEGAWNHLSRKVYCTFTDLSFQGARSATALTLWLVEWSYGFGVYDRLGGHAITIAQTYQRNLIGPLGLSDAVWFAAVAWAGFAALKGKITMAAGELVMSFVLAILAGVFLANPAGYLQGLFDTMGSTSGALFATASGEPPPENGIDADAVLAPLQGEIHSAFVEEPYDILNWGAPLTGQCATARDRILAEGPHGNDDAPRDAMNLAGCTEAADFNHDPNGTRLFGAVLTMVAALIMAVLITLVAVTVVAAQVVAIVLFSLAPFAMLAGVLPAGGRTLAWAWLGALGRVVLAVVGMSFLLSLLLLTVNAMLAGTADASILERFALVNLVVVVMFIARKRILAGG
ncbi:MAG TPA: type IV secretion system protein, partial [Acidimicrobiales bacterium]